MPSLDPKDRVAAKLAIALLRAGDRPRFEQLLAERAGLARIGSVILAAAGIHDVAAVKRLANAGADLDSLVRGYRPLHAAIQEKPHQDRPFAGEDRLSTVQTLLDLGADPSRSAAWPAMPALQVACGVGDREMVELLLSYVRVDAFSAAALGRMPLVRRALAADASFATSKDSNSLTALHYVACSRLHREPETGKRLREIATMLLDAGASSDALARSWSHEVTATDLAISSHHLSLVEILLRRGGDPTRALAAAMWNTGDRFRDYGDLCLGAGAKIDECVYENKPLLNQLVRWGKVEPVLWLVSLGANPNLEDDRGWTAVTQAKSRGNRRMWDALIAAGGRHE